jgi:site-specific recombinase XerD
MLEALAPPRRRSYITLPGYRAGMKPPNAGKTYPAEVLTREEIGRLLAACSARGSAGLRTRALIVLLYRSGLRIDEALALHPKDVDLVAGTITVLHGKGNRRRTVGIDGQALAVLELWLRRRRELGLGNMAPIFCTISKPTAGKKMYSSVVREAFKDLAVKAGIEKRVHPHGFRHTHASELAREGVSIHLIQRQLGHSDLATTARYIDHLTPWEVIDAIHGREDWA